VKVSHFSDARLVATAIGGTVGIAIIAGGLVAIWALLEIYVY
jgi:hypothetical protein